MYLKSYLFISDAQSLPALCIHSRSTMALPIDISHTFGLDCNILH